MRHKLWTTLIIVLGVLSITPTIIITRTWFIVHTTQRPTQTAGGYVLEEQTEDFTCGVHALSTVYRAYGLDPEEERIHWRLGVDTKAIAWLGDSTGALHPDLWMILVQDYFEITTLDPADSASWEGLRAFLDIGHPAVLLIRRRENGNLHWIVATRTLDEGIEVYDPLFDEPYTETPDFLVDHVVTLMCVRPTPDGEQPMWSGAALWEGTGVLLDARERIELLEPAGE